ncbi:hypothetical protein J4443_02580 [Candidatus Woesearchaeota archaeon]|nr:hypothetical protein [Candidatus Woesearchaeota archaeon]
MNVRLMILGCLFYLLLLPLAYADEGKTFELDFNANDRYDLWLQKSDRILFEYGGYNNTLIIDEIKDNSIELDLFLFLERGLHTPDYLFLTKKYELRLDFDKKGGKELSINLLNIDSEKDKVNLLFRRLEDWDPEADIDLSDWNVADEKINEGYFQYFLPGIIIIAVLSLSIILLHYLHKGKTKGTYF